MEFVGVAHDLIDLGHCREGLRIKLRRTPGHQDSRVRPLAMRASDRLSRLPHGFIGDRAAVDDHPVFVGPGKPADRLALREIQPATERNCLDAHASVPRSISPLNT